MLSLTSRARRLLLCLVLAPLLALAGCVSVDGLEPEDVAAVQAGERTVVLFRVILTSNAGPMPAFEEALETQCMSIGVSDPDLDGRVSTADGLQSFSDETLEQGWLYFLLPPGKHAVAVNPPSLYDARGENRWEETAHWGFEIPPGTNVVYVGTVRAHCRAEVSDFGGARIREIRAQKILNQSDAAAQIAAAHLKGLDPPVTLPTKRLFVRESNILRGVN